MQEIPPRAAGDCGKSNIFCACGSKELENGHQFQLRRYRMRGLRGGLCTPRRPRCVRPGGSLLLGSHSDQKRAERNGGGCFERGTGTAISGGQPDDGLFQSVPAFGASWISAGDGYRAFFSDGMFPRSTDRTIRCGLDYDAAVVPAGHASSRG